MTTTEVAFAVMPSPELVVARWCEHVRQAYLLAKGQRLGELRERRAKTFDARGLHPFTIEIGKAFMCQELIPALADLEMDPVKIGAAAKRDAEMAFREEMFDQFRREEKL